MEGEYQGGWYSPDAYKGVVLPPLKYNLTKVDEFYLVVKRKIFEKKWTKVSKILRKNWRTVFCGTGDRTRRSGGATSVAQGGLH